MPPPMRTVPNQKSSPLINTAQPRPQAGANSRQLPSLPIPIRQLPNLDHSSSIKPFFEINSTETEDELDSTRYTHSGELFYYQTSSSSSSSSRVHSNQSLSLENSEHENNEEQIPNENQEEEEDEQDDDDEGEEDEEEVEEEDADEDDDQIIIDQRSTSDEEEDQTSPYEYEA